MNRIAFQQKILSWFSHNKRPLPWRTTYHPYHIWISEIMLQQTQMDRAVVYFRRWMDRYPDIASVAAADEDEILKMWEGLGYYSRARNIRKAAGLILARHGGAVPDDYEALLSLPGIGPYTAGAIMSLAFNHDYPVVDANIERVFSRLFNIETPIKEKNAHTLLLNTLQDIIPKGKARDFNQALMELGALVCAPRNPKCHECPVPNLCEARFRGLAAERPVLPEKKDTVHIAMATGVLIHQGRIFVQKRLSNDIWANLWEFPGGRLKDGETPEQAVVREFLEETGFTIEGLERIGQFRHSYTIYRVVLHGFYCALENGKTTPTLSAAQAYEWIRPEKLPRYAFPAGHRKLVQAMLSTSRFRERLASSLHGLE